MNLYFILVEKTNTVSPELLNSGFNLNLMFNEFKCESYLLIFLICVNCGANIYKDVSWI